MSDSLAGDAVIALFSGLVGAFLREIFALFKGPCLEMSFEEYDGKKPYVHELVVAPGRKGVTKKRVSGVRAKFLRLVVKNGGFTPAKDCEAKLTVKQNGEPPYTTILHWARRDPTIYSKLDDIFGRITVDRKDSEFLDVLKLERNASVIETMSCRVFEISPHVDYELKVSVFPSNTGPVSKKFKLEWDGTYSGFDNCVYEEI